MRALTIVSALGLLASTPAWAQETAAPLLAQAQEGRYEVYFALGSARLDASALSVVAAAAEEFQRLGSTRISVRGHTDTTGSPEANQALSDRRARAVADELIRRGVPEGAITSEALGETQLAVQTGDEVPENQNRRVDIDVEQPAPPAPAPAPEPIPAPAPAPVAEAPEPEPQGEPRASFNVGGYYGFNLRDEGNDDEDGTSHFAGLNLSFDYRVLDWVSVGLEQAGFYHFATEDDGFGGRSAAGVDLTIGNLAVLPYVGANIGYIYGSGIDDDWFAGPEIGIALGPLNAKLAYDMPFDRDLDEGIISATVGLGIRF